MIGYPLLSNSQKWGFYLLCRKHSGPHPLVNQMWKQGCTKSEVFPQLLYFCASTSRMRLRRSECKWINCTPKILLNTELVSGSQKWCRQPWCHFIFQSTARAELNLPGFFMAISRGMNGISLLAALSIPPKCPRRIMLCAVSRPVSIKKSSLNSPDNNELPDCACSTSH